MWQSLRKPLLIVPFAYNSGPITKIILDVYSLYTQSVVFSICSLCYVIFHCHPRLPSSVSIFPYVILVFFHSITFTYVILCFYRLITLSPFLFLCHSLFLPSNIFPCIILCLYSFNCNLFLSFPPKHTPLKIASWLGFRF